jgi:hypothetical protein
MGRNVAQDAASAELDEKIAASPRGTSHGTASVEGIDDDPLADLADGADIDTFAKASDRSSVYSLRSRRQQILERDSFSG